ncbi:MAG: hypothetical protein L3J33_03300 [Rhodobacteraceae bacterium]|nr:hypothetical protein [Paracoccaceae bacterium]
MNEILELWPSMAELARDLGVKQGIVAGWRRNNSIPAKYDGLIVRHAKTRGIDLSYAKISEARANVALAKQEADNG